MAVLALALALPALRPLGAQTTTGATFGEVISLGGTPSDVVLDELRGRLYLVNDKTDRVDVFDYAAKRVVTSIQVGRTPLAAAMSMDSAWLYVTNNGNSTLSVIDLSKLTVMQSVLLPSRPEGVEVGADGRVLVSMVGTGVIQGVPQGTLVVFDPNQMQGQQLFPVAVPALPTTPAPLPATFLSRPITTFRGKLMRTPDGQFIVGVITPNNNSTYIFVYEAASGVVIRNRTTGGQSSVISMAPDGSRFMTGLAMYDTATLAVIGQTSNANAPFNFNAAVNLLQNIGGSAFTPDGATLYSAFNVAPTALPQPRPQASTLLISDARNLAIRLGIKMPESIVAKMVMTADGAHAWGMSESGLLYLPLGKLYDYPILMPETTQVFLAMDECNRGMAQGTLKINNLGKGRLTYSVPNTGSALIAQVSSGIAPSTITFTMEPGRSGILRRPGTNIWTNVGTMSGSPFTVSLASTEAINLPNLIRVYMNYRQPDQRGIIFPVPTVPNGNEGLQDLVLDEPRGRLYITNSGYNRVEVFDLRRQRFIEPMKVGQLPHAMALSPDGNTLYVGNIGGESISVVDLDLARVVGSVDFPPVPRNGTAGPIYPRTLAMGQFGLQWVMSDGSLWKLVGAQAIPRPVSTVIQQATGGVRISNPANMIASPDSRCILTLAGNGLAFLYDSTVDQYTAGRLLFNTPGNPIQGYYGVLAAGPQCNYLLANGLILNSSMTIIGGSERPGTTGFVAPTQPGQPPSQTIVNTGQRNVAAVASLTADTFVRMTTPVRQNVTTATRDDERPTLEVVNLTTGTESLAAVAPENPVLKRARHRALQRAAAHDGGGFEGHLLRHHAQRSQHDSALAHLRRHAPPDHHRRARHRELERRHAQHPPRFLHHHQRPQPRRRRQGGHHPCTQRSRRLLRDLRRHFRSAAADIAHPGARPGAGEPPPRDRRSAGAFPCPGAEQRPRRHHRSAAGGRHDRSARHGQPRRRNRPFARAAADGTARRAGTGTSGARTPAEPQPEPEPEPEPEQPAPPQF